MMFVNDTAKNVGEIDNIKLCLLIELLNNEQVFKDLAQGVIFDTKDPSDPGMIF